METVISLEYNELIRDGEFEMVSKIQDFLDSEVDDWKLSVTAHLWCDYYFRLLRRHFLFTASSWESWRRTRLGAIAVRFDHRRVFESGSV